MKNVFMKKAAAYFFCALFLILQVVPIGVFAETSEAEPTSVSDFEQLLAAVSDGQPDILLTADITCTSTIALDGSAIKISGDYKLINPIFSGSGNVTLDVPASRLEVIGSVALTATKQLTAEATGAGLKAAGSSTVTVNADVTGFDGSNGVEVYDTAFVTVNGDIKVGASTEKGGNAAVLTSGKLTVTGNIIGGDGNAGGGSGAVLEKGVFTVTGNVIGGSVPDGSESVSDGGIGIHYIGTSSSEIIANITGDVIGGESTTGNGGAGVSCDTNKFNLTVSGTVSGGDGAKNGGNGIELFYGDEIITASVVSGGNGTTKGAVFVDKTSTDVFGAYADDTPILVPAYAGTALRLISGKKSNGNLRNLVFDAYEFNIIGKFGASSGIGSFQLEKGIDDLEIDWELEEGETIYELYQFTLEDSEISATYYISDLEGKEVLLLCYADETVDEVWSGEFSSEGITIADVVSDGIYAIVTKEDVVTYTVTTTAGENGTVDPIGETKIPAGQSFSFTITPDEGYQVDEFIINDIKQEAKPGTYKLKNVTDDVIISVTFKKIKKVSVTVTAGTGGSINPIGTVSVDEGSSITFLISPDEGYMLDKFTVNEIEVTVTDDQFTLSNITVESTVRVTFKPTDEKFTIKVSAGEGGRIVPSGDQEVTYGGSITFTIQPDEGYIINKLYLDNKIVQPNNNKYTLSNVTSDHKIDVTFVEEDSVGAMIVPDDVNWSSETIRISLADYTRVSADVIDKIVDSYSSKEIVFYASQYEIIFSPHTMSKISENYIDFGLILDNSSNNSKLSEIGNGKFVKVFSFANTVKYLPAEASVRMYLGTQYIGRDVTIYWFDESAGEYKQQAIDSVDIDGYATVTTSSPLEFVLVTDLLEQSFIVNATAGEGGSVTPTGESTFSSGATAIFTFAPDAGYEIDELEIDGVVVELEGNSYTFETIDANHTLHVTFKQVTENSNSDNTKPKNTAMIIIIIFLVVVLVCAIIVVVLYKMGIIKLKSLKF